MMNLKEFQSIQFIGLKAKMYCIFTENAEEANTAKGANISIEFKEYSNFLFNKKLIRHKIKRIRSKLHKRGSYDVCKISLSCFDDKRYFLNDGITTFKKLEFS